jgi:MFS family permease
MLGSLASLTGIASAIGPIAAGWLYDKSTVACFLFEAGFAVLGMLLLGHTPLVTRQEAENP